MIVTRTFPPRLPRGRRLAAAIGVFDGVHIGHQAILAETLRRARAARALPAVITFDRHPLATLAPHVAPRNLMTLDQRLERLRALGFRAVVVLPFSRRLAAMTAPVFARRVLAGSLRVSEVVAGYDFHFGRGGAGDGALLAALGARLGFRTAVMPPVLSRGEPVSSTRIRKLVTLGCVGEASRLLGRPYTIRGPVVRGRRLARRLGFPTINIRPENDLLPRYGVYAVRISACGRSPAPKPGVANLGIRPTVRPLGSAPLLEVHVLGSPPATPPGRRFSVELLHFLRPERTFPGLAALSAAIRKDAAAARTVLRRPPAGRGLTRRCRGG